ncbi:MAG TPA: NAD(P)-dependent oxidoreductase [Alphaproteobacteria bacterium]|jgi:3-hydroxyisobutyrate dehydrogenase-like beta-hydroxyacid dehydrogenase
MPAAIAYGFIGLGRMGGPMAANLAKAGVPLAVFDKAGTAERAPPGARAAQNVAEIAAASDAIFLSLPAGPDVHAVLAEILAARPRRAAGVIDLSTIGIAAAQEAARRAGAAGLFYLDAPVSGGRAGAIAATIAVMCAGPRDKLEAHRPALAAMAKNVFHVGDKPGQGQALKLLNNFLSATATAATAEALLFGRAQGLELKTMLDVVNVSTGASAASQGKYMRNVLPGTFDSGFGADQMAKDLRLYREALAAAGTAGAIGKDVAALWEAATAELGNGDHTRVFEFLAKREKTERH